MNVCQEASAQLGGQTPLINVEARVNQLVPEEIPKQSSSSVETQSGIDDFPCQSGKEVAHMGNELKSETVRFSDTVGDFVHDYTSAEDPTRSLMDTSDASLENFFSRPIKIFDQSWSTSTVFAANFDPWALYFENLRVINRISNFNLMRAKLHVKFVINGNSFHYGRILASYLPFDQYDTLSSFSALIPEDAVQESQCPHIFLDPTTSTGGTLMLPYFNFWNSTRITANDWQELGQVYMRSLNALQHANGASDVAKVSIFAWAEDVTLTIPTSDEPSTLAPQMGKESEIDEANKKGTISGPATAIAKIAGALSVIPVIAPYAKATEVGMTTLSKVAKEMGYCAPPVTKDPEPFKPAAVSAMACTTVPQQLQKLTIDDKQELSIDPAIAGVERSDPMTIANIAGRESYLTTFNWNMGTGTETLLWNSRVDPGLWAESGIGPVGFHFPALAMAAMPFQFWTGTLKFRFQIVCSAYHKGRLKFVYDPNYMKSVEYNVNYMEIVDLADKNDFTISVGAAQATTLMKSAKYTPGVTELSDMYGTTALGDRPDIGNGMLGVYVVNELTTPNSTITNNIQINVFVSAGDDFEVFVPSDDFQYYTFKPQSGLEEWSAIGDNSELDAPEQTEDTEVGTGATNTSDKINLVFTGEAITSFRTLLKRPNLHQTLFNLPNKSSRWVDGRRSSFPYLRGNVNAAVNTTGAGQPYNYCNTVLLHWVTYAFSGWRGSIRWKIIPRGNIYDDSYNCYVQRAKVGGSEYDQGVNFAPNYGSQDAAAYSSVVEKTGITFTADKKPLAGPLGLGLAVGSINKNLEFEMPFYSQFRFVPGKQESHTGISIFSEPWDYRIGVSGDNSTTADAFCSAGEDFQVYFFTGLPRMYYEATAPVP